MAEGRTVTSLELPEPGRLFGPPTELGSLWFEEIRRTSEGPSIAWSEATEIAGKLLGNLAARIEGHVEGPIDLADGALPEVEEVIALRTVFRSRASERLPPDAAMEVLGLVDQEIDRLVGSTVRSRLRVLESAAFLDPLTGVGNRRALDRDLSRELARSFRHGRPVTVACVDLDGLKVINDSKGHAAGDAALRRLASALTDSLRVGDVVYRVGGDEFVVLLPETPADAVQPLLDRAAVTAPAFSYGLAEAPGDATTADALLALADADLIARRRLVRAHEADEPVIDLAGAERELELEAELEPEAEAEEPAAEPEVAPAPEPRPVELPAGGRLVIQEITTSATDREFTALAVLAQGDHLVTGRATGPRAAAAANRVVASAALDAVAQVDDRWRTTFLESVAVVQVGETDVAVVNVVVADGVVEESSAGVAQVRQDRRDLAVARALLDALNRRLSARPPVPVEG